MEHSDDDDRDDDEQDREEEACKSVMESVSTLIIQGQNEGVMNTSFSTCSLRDEQASRWEVVSEPAQTQSDAPEIPFIHM